MPATNEREQGQAVSAVAPLLRSTADSFIHGADRLAENFPLVVEHLLTPAEFRKRAILELMQPRHGISPGYKILADFVMRDLVRTILTTNFDTCIQDTENSSVTVPFSPH